MEAESIMNFGNFVLTALEYLYVKIIRTVFPNASLLNFVLNRIQLYKFRRIVKFAFEHSKFYRELYIKSGIKKEDIPYLNYNDVPIVTKEDLINNVEDIWTDPNLKKEDLTHFLEENKGHSCLFHDKYYCFTTSGTLGEKLPVLYTKSEWEKYLTIMIINAFRTPQLGKKKMKIAAILLCGGTSAAVTTMRAMPKERFDVKEISLLKSLDEIVEELNEFQPDRVTSYPGMFLSLLQLQKSGKLKISPKVIGLGGEKLTCSQQAEIAKTFNATVINQYGTSECIIIGKRLNNEEEFCLFPQLAKAEILDENQKYVKNGESGQVVLTNLTNYTQPFIRYAIGDLVLAGENKKGEFCIKDFVARNYKPVYFHTNNGEKTYFHPAVFHEMGTDVPGIEKFQIVVGNNMLKALIVGTEEGANHIKNAFTNLIKERSIDQNVKFDLDLVSEISPEQNGKIPFIKYEKS